MKQYGLRLLNLVFGLFLYGLGIVVTVRANIGYAPWEVFHAGIAASVGSTIGRISIIVGIVLVGVAVLLKEKIGLGTLLNMVLIGVFVDLIMWAGVIPEAANFAAGVVMLVCGLFIISVGSYFYIKSAFGAGPRDSLMVAFNRRTGIPIGVCRGAIELTVAVSGWLLGGMLGLGTVISVVAVGLCIQLTFRLFRFDAAAVRHETFRFGKQAVKAAEEEAAE